MKITKNTYAGLTKIKFRKILDEKKRMGAFVKRSSSFKTEGARWAVVGVLACTLLTIPQVEAQIRVTSDEEGGPGLVWAHGVLGGAHLSSTIIAVVPLKPLDDIAANAAFATDMSLKATPPLFRPPVNVSEYPDTDNSDYCHFSYYLPQVSSSYQNDLGFFESTSVADDWGPLSDKESSWSDLNSAPYLFHANAEVDLRLSGLAQGAGELPSGYYPVTWEAVTQLSPTLDIAFPLLAQSAFNKLKHAKKVKSLALAKRKGVEFGSNVTEELTNRAVSIGLSVGDSVDTAINSANGLLTVWDVTPPYFRDPVNNAVIENQTVILEATDYGGARLTKPQNRARLRSNFDIFDDCGNELNLTLPNPPTFIPVDEIGEDVVWNLSEDVPYNHSALGFSLASNQSLIGNAGLRTVLTQRVIVRDTQAPLLVAPDGFATETTQNIDLNSSDFSLGTPLVADLADPRPRYENDAPQILQAPDESKGETGRRYAIQWSATDFTGNSTEADENQLQYRQLVTLKLPGTNTAPQALTAEANTTTSNKVAIRLRGEDVDFIDGLFDPLSFEIEVLPENGGFEAPLLPYFIEDLRLTPESLPTGEDQTEISCPDDRTSSEELEGRLGLIDPNQHSDFIIRCYCSIEAQAEQNNGLEFLLNPNNPQEIYAPTKYIYSPRYVHIDDDDFYFINDAPQQCSYQGSTRSTQSVRRISKWKDNAWVAEHQLSETDLSEVLFDIDDMGRVWWSEVFGSPGARSLVLYSLDNDLNPWADPSRSTGVVTRYEEGDSEINNFDSGGMAHVDTVNGVIYINEQRDVYAYSLEDPEQFIGRIRNESGGRILTQNSGGQGEPNFMQTDSEGNLYVADRFKHQIHKISAPTAENGEIVLGKYVGWLGKCNGNAIDANGVPFNNCDVNREVSKGYQCTDTTCNRNFSFPQTTSGSEPGQFNNPAHINMGPEDILYVADRDNNRIQRFLPDGTFAGEAVSVDDGVIETAYFVLGNMGRPRNVSVNSTSFHVLERNEFSRENQNDNFLHIFKTIPFYDITDNAVSVDYVSNFNFQGEDTFTFSVDDGIAKSEAATVTIDVTRSFRAPFDLIAQCFTDETLSSAADCVLDEDTELFIRFTGSDSDGFSGTGESGLDEITFSLVQDLNNGALTQVSTKPNSAVYRYSPNENFYGEDSLVFTASNFYGDSEPQFSATNGHQYSDENVSVSFTVNPVYDPPTLDLPETYTVPRGFDHVLKIEYDDVDRDPDKDFTLWFVSWGDSEPMMVKDGPSGDWINHGLFDEEGKSINPIVKTELGKGLILARHNWTESTADLNVSYQGGVPGRSFETSAIAALDLKDTVLLSTQFNFPDGGVNPSTDFPFSVEIINQLPEGWAGLPATNVELTFELQEGMSLSGQSSALCPEPVSSERLLTCTIASIPAGGSTLLEFAAQITLETARQSPFVDIDLEYTHAGPHLDDSKSTFVGDDSVEIRDQDLDGVIDVDDAFVTDPRYTLDSDGDGLADAWEEDNGFNPNDASDAALDTDGDGRTNLQEFLDNTPPRLANDDAITYAQERLVAADTTAEDQLGFVVRTGDVNGDGFEDLVASAPNLLEYTATDGSLFAFEGEGAVFIWLGDGGGQFSERPVVIPSWGPSDWGRSLAVADFDGNGVDDIAIGFESGYVWPAPIGGYSSSVALYLNQVGELDSVESGLLDEEIPLFIAGGNTSSDESSFGYYLLGEDIDNDDVADLLVGDPRYDGPLGSDQGAVFVYLAKDRYFDENQNPIPSEIVEGPAADARLGESLSIGELDGDNDKDLVVGVGIPPGSLPGNAYVYLGEDIRWSSGEAISHSKLIPGFNSGDRFGFSVAANADVDGDGLDDLLVGAYGDDAAYLYLSTDAYLDQLDPTPSFTATGSSGSQFGVRVAMVESVNNDDMADFVIGGNRDAADSGIVSLFIGASEGSAINDPNNYQGEADTMLGYFVDSAGDFNDDGLIDFVSGAPAINKGVSGAVQVFIAGAEPTETDSDNDLVADTLDNCPNDLNRDQSDVDLDGAGDVCDQDIDNDGIANVDDNCPSIANSTQENFDGDADGNVCDNDDDNDDVADADDAFPFDPAYSTDTDGDGLPDAYENMFGLNAEDASDAANDSDSDGRTNLEEYNQGGDPQVDDVAPVLTIPADILVDSTGPLTAVSLGTAQATDGLDGSVNAAPSRTGPFLPGRHEVIWEATDAAGNTATGTQIVDVTPQLSFVGRSRRTSEGDIFNLTVQLNGEAVTYPVEAQLSFGGTAALGDDYSASTTMVSIAEGLETQIEFTINEDAEMESQETISVEISSPANALIGEVAQFEVVIDPVNIAPLVDFVVTQNDQARSIIAMGSGNVFIRSIVEDANTSDMHTFDWSQSDAGILPLSGTNEAYFAFDPFTMDPGVYSIALTVTDSGTGNLSSMVSRDIRIVEAEPELSDEMDTDGDGVSDADEGLADENNNGVSDYLEFSNQRSQLPAQTGTASVLQTESGLLLTLGSTAFWSGDDASVDLNDIAIYGNDGMPAENTDDNAFAYNAGIFDFVISGLADTSSARIVLPLTQALPVASSYRKYLADIGWQNFEMDSQNLIESAAGEQGVCPRPGHDDYVAGLNEGHWCVQLTIEDGGPNDADMEVNGVIVDPSGAGTPTIADADGDGIADGSDNCPNNANSNQLDTDNDGLGDVCDPTPNGPVIADADGDGIADGSDNCPNNANSNQLDTDNDGLGDVCDPTPNGNGGGGSGGGGGGGGGGGALSLDELLLLVFVFVGGMVASRRKQRNITAS